MNTENYSTELATLNSANGALVAGCMIGLRVIRSLAKEYQIPEYIYEPDCEKLCELVRLYSNGTIEPIATV